MFATFYRLSLILGLSLLCSTQLMAQPELLSVSEIQGTVSKFQKIELDVELNSSITEYFNFSKINLIAVIQAPDQSIDTIDGFYYQEYEVTGPDELSPVGDPFWKIRYTPTQTGNYTYQVVIIDLNGYDEWEELSFDVSDSDEPGFLRMGDNNYLIHDNGEGFFGTAVNIAWDDFSNGFSEYEGWFESFSQNGGNYAKLMMTPWGFDIEWEETGLYNYWERMHEAYALDMVMEQAHDRDIYVQLAFIIHNELRIVGEPWIEIWHESPYNIENGGPCETNMDFFTNEEAKEAFKNLMRYIIARWAYDPEILAWEIISEGDNFPDFDEFQEDIRFWCYEMADYLHMNDPNNHLVTIGFAIADSDLQLWESDLINFSQHHLYPNQDQDLELELYSDVRAYIDVFEKPSIVGEFSLGYDPDTIALYDPGGIAFHNGLWASAMAGSFGTALSWWWDNYIDPMDLWHVYKGISAFFNEVDLRYEEPEFIRINTETTETDDLEIEPGFFNLQILNPSNQFELFSSGYMMPYADSLGMILYGTGSVSSQYRNPPYFQVFYPEDGEFYVYTGEQAFNSTLKIWLNGELMLIEDVDPISEYFIEIPAGQHEIHVENSNDAIASFMIVEKYVFTNVYPRMRALGFKLNAQIICWIKNRDYNWQQIYGNGLPQPISDGQLIIEDIADGLYAIDWFNTITGEIDSSTSAVAAAQQLSIEVDGLLWDKALLINLIDNTSEYDQNKRQNMLRCFPNPFDNHINIRVSSEITGLYDLTIYDLQGRRIRQLKDTHDPSSLQSFQWNGIDESGNKVKPGVYLIQLNSAAQSFTNRLIYLGS